MVGVHMASVASKIARGAPRRLLVRSRLPGPGPAPPPVPAGTCPRRSTFAGSKPPPINDKGLRHNQYKKVLRSELAWAKTAVTQMLLGGLFFMGGWLYATLDYMNDSLHAASKERSDLMDEITRSHQRMREQGHSKED